MTSYTDRYVDAAMRTVPEDSRVDLSAELRVSIDDAIEARTEGGEPRDDAERAVLTELGDPERLAAGYVDRPLHLIGPTVYLDWWRLLRLLLWIAVPIATVGIVLGRMASGAGVGEVFGTAVTAILTVGVHVVFWTTLLFVIVERTGARSTKTEWSVEELPEVRASGAGRADLVASLIFLVIMIGAVVWDRLIGFVQIDGVAVPVLNPGLWPVWISVLLVVVAAEAVFAIMLYRAGRWTRGLVVVNGVLAIVAAAIGLGLLASGTLLNPEFFTAVASRDPGSVQQVVSVGVAVGMVVTAGWDIVDGVIKSGRQHRAAK